MNDNSEERNVALNFLAGMGVGALIGAVAALLLAPKSGRETRDELLSTADEIKQKADKAMHDLSESSDELVAKSKEILETTRAKVQQAIDAGKQAVARKHADLVEEAEATEG